MDYFQLESSDVVLMGDQTVYKEAFFMKEDDIQFFHKKQENFVVIKLQLEVDFNVDTTEPIIGFLMKISTLRAKKEPFELTVPVFINLGKLKRPQ